MGDVQILAIVIGAAYYNLPPTAAGAFTRGSVMFAALLTSCLDTFGEVDLYCHCGTVQILTRAL